MARRWRGSGFLIFRLRGGPELRGVAGVAGGEVIKIEAPTGEPARYGSVTSRVWTRSSSAS